MALVMGVVILILVLLAVCARGWSRLVDEATRDGVSAEPYR